MPRPCRTSIAIRSKRVRGSGEVGRKWRSKHIVGSTDPTMRSIGTATCLASPGRPGCPVAERTSPALALVTIVISPSTSRRSRIAGRPRSHPASLAQRARRRARSKSSLASASGNPVCIVLRSADLGPADRLGGLRPVARCPCFSLPISVASRRGPFPDDDEGAGDSSSDYRCRPAQVLAPAVAIGVAGDPLGRRAGAGLSDPGAAAGGVGGGLAGTGLGGRGWVRAGFLLAQQLASRAAQRPKCR